MNHLIDEDFQRFMGYWFAGLFKGLEDVDESAREAILKACGEGCADSYTVKVFQDVRQQSADIETLLTNLAHRFPEATYEYINPREIRVTYSHCACDLVERKLTRSPTLCRCSVYNLQTNFEKVFNVPVDVTLQTSILRGEKNCIFSVSFLEAPEFLLADLE